MRPLWHNILFMIINPIAAIVLTTWYGVTYGFTWGHLVLLIITYSISNMSITCGYHRYFSHRSYDAHPIVDILYVLFGSGAFQGSVLTWCTDHRRHHKKVDTNEDPYSINKGFWYAHLFWMFHEDPHPEAKAFPHDLTKSRFIVFQHEHYAWIAAFMGYIVPGLVAWACGLGFWSGVIVGGALRITLSQHSTFLINSAAHTFGTQPYTNKNTARDSHLLAFLTFGEGYHNFHHYFQADYRNGVRWYQWDPTKWWIQSLASVGLVTRLRKTRREEIFKAKLTMDEHLMLSRGACSETVGRLKSRVVEAQEKMRHLRDDYYATKASFYARKAELRREMQVSMDSHREQWKQFKERKREEFKAAKREFSAACAEWHDCRRMLLRAPATA